MTEKRFQNTLDKITGSIVIPQELMARGIYQETVDALRMATRHAEVEAAAEGMATALEVVTKREDERIKQDRRISLHRITEVSLYITASEALARWRKSREAGG